MKSKNIQKLFQKFGFSVVKISEIARLTGNEVIIELTGTEEKILDYEDFLKIKEKLQASILEVSYKTNGTYKKPLDFQWSYRR